MSRDQKVPDVGKLFRVKTNLVIQSNENGCGIVDFSSSHFVSGK